MINWIIVLSVLSCVVQCQREFYYSQQGILDLDGMSHKAANQELENLKIEIDGNVFELFMDGDVSKVYPELKNDSRESCYYSGSINGIPNSHFLISFCNDLNGLLLVDLVVYRISFHPLYGINGADIKGNDDLFGHILKINNQNPILKGTQIFNVLNKVLSVDPLIKDLMIKYHWHGEYGIPEDSYVPDVPESDTNNYLKHDLNGDDGSALTDRNYNAQLRLKIALFVESSAGLDKRALRNILAQVNQYYSSPTLGVRVIVEAVHYEPIRTYTDYTVDSLLRLFRNIARKKLASQRPELKWNTALFVMKSKFYGKDSRGRKSGMITGYATVGSVCSGNSVAMVRGTLNTYANTIAHELGHNLGLPHDSENGCRNNFIMASVAKGQSTWSRCSRSLLINSLHKVRCLIRPGDDISNDVDSYRNSRRYSYTNDYRLDSTPGGVDKGASDYYYNLHPDSACNVRFGVNYKSYSSLPNEHICEAMLCYNPTESSYPDQDGSPAPNGTICANNRLCYGGKCLHWEMANRLKAMDDEKSRKEKLELDQIDKQITVTIKDVRNLSNLEKSCLSLCLTSARNRTIDASVDTIQGCGSYVKCKDVPPSQFYNFKATNRLYIGSKGRTCWAHKLSHTSVIREENLLCMTNPATRFIICVERGCLTTSMTKRKPNPGDTSTNFY